MNSNNSSEIDFESMFPDKKTLEIYVNGNNNLGLKDNQGNTLLMYVCFLHYTDILLTMLSKGANAVNLADVNGNGQSALAIACMLNLKQVALKMLEFGPDAVNINSKDQANDTPFMEVLRLLEKDSSFYEIAVKILDFSPRKLDLTIVNNDDYTALMLACKFKLQNIIFFLLESFDGQTYDLNLFQENEEGETALDIALRNDLIQLSDLISIKMREEEQYQIDIPTESNTTFKKVPVYASGLMPSLSLKDIQLFQQNQSLSIDLQTDGWDPFLFDNENIYSYLNQDVRDNIAIKYVGKVYLCKRSILQRQKEEATVFECLESNKKDSSNIVYNLPLFNIKKIGINISSDSAVGIEPEYIYMDGINKIVENNSSLDIQQNLFSIIPLPDKTLVSIISLEEVNNIGFGFSEASSLHCQTGQYGLAGLIVKASGMNHFKGGFHKKKKNISKKVGIKKKNKTKLRKRK